MQSDASCFELLTKFSCRFGAIRVDICPTCESFHNKLKAAEGDEKNQLEQEHHKHVVAADQAYKFQQHDKQETGRVFSANYEWAEDAHEIEFNSVDAAEFQCQDAGGNLRTPRLRQGEAFYKRILQTYVYGIYSGARKAHSLYFWNEVISCF